MTAASARRIIEVVDYNPQWQQAFNIEQGLLKGVIGNNAITIEHIGSTAVVGLAAKPIIDILIEVSSLELLDRVNESIAELGYVVKGENGISGRRYFQKGGHQRSHHIHAFVADDPHLERHRAFKAYLSHHSAIAQEYSKLKQAAAVVCDNDMTRYMALKNDFIAHHETLAVQWFRHS
ncbi:GrpB family protein [Psychrobium sp. 1_MG-2023]|uniref:GrpB family protein n=1 Tax=Psychrobium sp. 1_MG-2023 TaxID=3062624 RepID=UPI000C332F02|nr:GrpB family protein [Psychrobium sp. 1_MG-2023]MDP2559638.1 GrpB family protein [Psychrobium sp. 1_MG-2023]PKF59470.1 hypothetical protein CW748_01485 [Alteromonadales bacterium alter-6D02]